MLCHFENIVVHNSSYCLILLLVFKNDQGFRNLLFLVLRHIAFIEEFAGLIKLHKIQQFVLKFW
jgi:hypothetical protein